jgi:hypothetical protein
MGCGRISSLHESRKKKENTERGKRKEREMMRTYLGRTINGLWKDEENPSKYDCRYR